MRNYFNNNRCVACILCANKRIVLKSRKLILVKCASVVQGVQKKYTKLIKCAKECKGCADAYRILKLFKSVG